MSQKPTYKELEQRLVGLEGNKTAFKLELETLQTAYGNLERTMEKNFADLTKRNVELELAASVFENTMEGIVITDKDGTIQKVNGAFTFITGFSPEEAIGKNPRMLKSEKHDPEFYKKVLQEYLGFHY